MTKRIAAATLAAASMLLAAPAAHAQRTNEEIDRNDDGIVCIVDRRGGFGTTLTDNNTQASESGCPANSIPVPIVP